MIDIENMKCIVEQEIKKRHYESLHYVLFDENKNIPWATHLFYRDNKFMINSRDERSYVVGITWEYDTIDEAIDKFMSILKQTINAEHLASELGFSHPYSSPLWDED